MSKNYLEDNQIPDKATTEFFKKEVLENLGESSSVIVFPFTSPYSFEEESLEQLCEEQDLKYNYTRIGTTSEKMTFTRVRTIK